MHRTKKRPGHQGGACPCLITLCNRFYLRNINFLCESFKLVSRADFLRTSYPPSLIDFHTSHWVLMALSSEGQCAPAWVHSDLSLVLSLKFSRSSVLLCPPGLSLTLRDIPLPVAAAPCTFGCPFGFA